MTETTGLALGAGLTTRRSTGRSGTLAGALVARPTLTIAVVWLALVVLAALLPGALTHHDPLAADPAAKLTAPDAAHWFGTDQLGRDLYARVVHGTALTLQAAVLAIAIGLVGGSLVGLVAGFVGGVVDAVLMRVADVLLAIPSLLLSLTIVTVLGFGTVNVAVAVGVASIATIARIMRSEVVRVRTAQYVEAASANGNRWWRVLLVHVLPNAAGPVLVLAALEFGTAILAVSSLSFLGYGAQPPQPEWGSLVATGRDFIATSWWLTTIPGLVIAVTVLAGNRLARALDTERRAIR
ncbi:peptide/nickel transport system permease protein [Curtobacterium sp. PhB130]|uniref:ABC transporter permease n=1 Tax=unclassified Curtobacterium TaxID=257496 RepID=UPI000F4BA2CB|nr:MULTISPECIES: ABC transporter permease [unclassified Curtobacterium]ROS74036.1 peptide/nickel transport system permease protein [Curtobacterium sp. PhB130]TCK62854.1 peptide/nickel transport system permease protein [Curtobacterium sp. PhB136]